MATKVKTTVLWFVTPCSLKVLLDYNISQISRCDVMVISVGQWHWYLVFNSQALTQRRMRLLSVCQSGIGK